MLWTQIKEDGRKYSDCHEKLLVDILFQIVFDPLDAPYYAWWITLSSHQSWHAIINMGCHSSGLHSCHLARGADTGAPVKRKLSWAFFFSLNGFNIDACIDIIKQILVARFRAYKVDGKHIH